MPRSGDAFNKINIEIEAKHLNEEGTQRLVLSDLYRLKTEVSNQNETIITLTDQLDTYKIKYYETDKEKAILEEKLKAHKSFEILYTVGVALGSAIIAVTRLLEDGNVKNYLTLAGFTLIGVSLVCKLYNYNFKKPSSK